MATQRKMSFREFADDLEQVFDALERGDEEEVLVEKAGRRYRLGTVKDSEKPPIWQDYDPAKAWAAMRRSQGAFEGVDTEQLKLDIRAARGQDSKGRPGD